MAILVPVMIGTSIVIFIVLVRCRCFVRELCCWIPAMIVVERIVVGRLP
jgi:hypothetical protein